MTTVWDLIARFDVFFTIVGFVSVVMLASSLMFIAVLSLRDWLRRRRIPRIPAPAPLPPRHFDYFNTLPRRTVQPNPADVDAAIEQVLTEATRITRSNATDH